MTLCIAKKIDDAKYVFMSDSRLSGEHYKITDNATKIFKIDVAVELMNGNVFKTSYGACFSGSYLFASLIIEALGHFLSNIQAKSDTAHSFENIISLATKIIKQLRKRYFEECNKECGFKMIIGGWCPINEKFQFINFDLTQVDNTEDAPVGDIATSPITFSKQNECYIGSIVAEKEVKRLINSGCCTTHIEALKKVIDVEIDATVGGAIQVGLFKDKNFYVVGISESELVKANNFWTVKDKYIFRGCEFQIDDLNANNFVITTQFGLPFDEKRDELFKEANRRNEMIL